MGRESELCTTTYMQKNKCQYAEKINRSISYSERKERNSARTDRFLVDHPRLNKHQFRWVNYMLTRQSIIYRNNNNRDRNGWIQMVICCDLIALAIRSIAPISVSSEYRRAKTPDSIAPSRALFFPSPLRNSRTDRNKRDAPLYLLYAHIRCTILTRNTCDHTQRNTLRANVGLP